MIGGLQSIQAPAELAVMDPSPPMAAPSQPGESGTIISGVATKRKAAAQNLAEDHPKGQSELPGSSDKKASFPGASSRGERNGSKRRKKGKKSSMFEVVSPGKCGPGEQVLSPRSKRFFNRGQQSPLPLQLDRSRDGRRRKQATGVFTGQCVLVEGIGDVQLLHKEGCFGKGTKSRDAPRALLNESNRGRPKRKQRQRAGHTAVNAAPSPSTSEAGPEAGASQSPSDSVQECLQLSLVEVLLCRLQFS